MSRSGIPMWFIKDAGCDPEVNNKHKGWVEYIKKMNLPPLSKAPCDVTPIFYPLENDLPDDVLTILQRLERARGD